MMGRSLVPQFADEGKFVTIEVHGYCSRQPQDSEANRRGHTNLNRDGSPIRARRGLNCCIAWARLTGTNLHIRRRPGRSCARPVKCLFRTSATCRLNEFQWLPELADPLRFSINSAILVIERKLSNSS